VSLFLGRRTLLTGLAAGAGLAALGRPVQAANFRAVSHCWVPWNADPAGARAVHGIGARMTRAVFDTSGLPVSMKILPWRRCLNDLQQGHSHLGWSTVRAPEREVYLSYSKPVWLTSNLIFAAADDPSLPWKGWESLAGKTLGVVRGYGYGVDFDRLRGQGIRIEAVGNEDQQFSMLLNRRVDAFVMEWQSYLFLQRRRGATGGEFAATEIPLPEMSYHIVASRAVPEAVAALPLIDGAIDALRSDGTLAALLREGIDPTPPPAGIRQSRLPPG